MPAHAAGGSTADGTTTGEHLIPESEVRQVDDAPGSTPRRRRRLALTGIAVVLLVTLVAGLLWTTQTGDDGVVAPQRPDAQVSPSGDWLSGASGVGVATGDFGAWRGRPVEIAGTWADTVQAATELAQLRPGGEYGSWDRPLDVALASIGSGETWAEAAAGAYDDRWRESLTLLRELWGTRTATVYIRFAHEMNGDWYPWAVNADNSEDFIDSWRRFRDMQQEIFPEAQLVFGVTRESVGNGMDWRESFPGAQYVDVIGVDYYNQQPYVDTEQEWKASIDETDSYGAPKGLAQHLEFARSVGLPLAVPEWSGIAANGDSALFVKKMYEFFEENAGDGAGNLLYEIQFNVDQDDAQFQLYGADARMPNSSKAYQDLW